MDQKEKSQLLIVIQALQNSLDALSDESTQLLRAVDFAVPQLKEAIKRRQKSKH